MRHSMFHPAKIILSLVAVSLSLGATPAVAHHSFALFDSSKSLTLEGTVKQFEWTNPHSWIHLVVLGANKQDEEWLVELPGSSTLARDGWNKNYLKPGERISVRINPLKNGEKGGSLQSFRPGTEEPN